MNLSLAEENYLKSIFQLLDNLRVYIVKDIETRSIHLSRLSSVNLMEETPALVLSYQLYGNITNEDTIVSRNAVVHPGFVPACIPVEVLIYANE